MMNTTQAKKSGDAWRALGGAVDDLSTLGEADVKRLKHLKQLADAAWEAERAARATPAAAGKWKGNPVDMSDVMVAAVEMAIGTGSHGWGLIKPQRIIAAALRLYGNTPSPTGELARLRELVKRISRYKLSHEMEEDDATDYPHMCNIFINECRAAILSFPQPAASNQDHNADANKMVGPTAQEQSNGSE